MSSQASFADTVARGFSRALGGLLGIALALFGFLLMLWMLALGLAAAIGFTLWSLLRGRKPPPMSFRFQRQGFGGRRPPTGSRTSPASPPQSREVIDIEAREVDATRDDRD